MSYQSITLGCPELPLPCKDPKTGNLGAVRHFQIKSRLNQGKAIGELYRNYPPFSLSHTFLKMLKYASETVDKPGASPLLALIGEKSAGKTSSATLAMTLVDGTAPETFDCGGRSLDDVLFEPVIADPSANIIDALQEKFNSDAINPISKAQLESKIPSAIFKDENGNRKMDASLISPQEIEQAIEAIKTIADLEGIGNVSGIGLTYKEGPLIRAWRQAEKNEKEGVSSGSGRIIIDEIDKRTPGTGKSLQQVLLVLQGLHPTGVHKVSKNGMEFTFDMSKMPKGFSTVITGNDDRDLAESAGLSQSQASRMTIISVDKTVAEDLTQRICQSLCGMSLLVTEIIPEKDKDKWRTLQNLRTLGQDTPLTEEEAWLIKNYDKTLMAARQVAGFYLDWERIVDPENPEINDPILEATTEFREPPGVRMAQSHVLRAKANDLIDVSSDPAQPSANPLQSLLNQDGTQVERIKGLGERWEETIIESIQLSAGGPETKAKILEAAKLRGIIFEPDEENNPNKHRKLIRHLLATDKEEFVVTKETKVLQEKLYKEFLEVHKSLFKDKKPSIEELIPSRDLQSAINQLQSLAEMKTSDQTTYILNINREYVEGNKTAKPIECIPVLFTDNQAHYNKIKGMKKEEIHEALVDTEMLVTLIETPRIGDETVEAFWNEGWKKELKDMVEENGFSNETDIPECVKMLQGISKDLRVCKVLTRGSDGVPEPLLILDSPSTKNTWILKDQGTHKTTERKVSDTEMPASEAKNKKTESTKEQGHKVHVIPSNKVEGLIEELTRILPEECMNELSSSISAFKTGTTGEELSEIISATLKSRTVRNVKIPMRIEDPATEVESKQKGSKKSNNKEVETLST